MGPNVAGAVQTGLRLLRRRHERRCDGAAVESDIGTAYHGPVRPRVSWMIRLGIRTYSVWRQ
jgi:hypothetical protein